MESHIFINNYLLKNVLHVDNSIFPTELNYKTKLQKYYLTVIQSISGMVTSEWNSVYKSMNVRTYQSSLHDFQPRIPTPDIHGSKIV